MDFKHSTAGYFSKREGILSPDDKLLLLLCDKVVKVYNRESGKYIESITGHTKEITSCIFHPQDSNFLITSSLDSRIGFWDFQHGVYTFIEVPGPIESMSCPEGSTRNDLIFFSTQKQGGGGRVWALSITKRKIIEKVLKAARAPKLVCSPNGALQCAFERSSLILWYVFKGKQNSRVSDFIRISHSKTVTSVAICPNEKIVAVGDTTGRITCYYGLTIRKDGGFVPHKNLRKTGSGEIREDFPHNTLHWHSTAIVALKFTLDGVSLLSCASEEVFVVWSISEGRKSFLPRIGTSISTIIRLNTDVSQFVLCGVDNSAYLLSLPNLSLEEILRGITNDTYNRSCRSVRSINAMYAIPFQQENLLMVNTGSVIQVFDYKADKHITCLEITGEVFKGADDSPATTFKYRVTIASFSEDGMILFTVDSKNKIGTSINSIETLKVWEQITMKRHVCYQLVGCCESPHQPAIRTIGISKYRGSYRAFTAGKDSIKLWSKKSGTSSSWSCETTSKYFNEQVVEVGAFSQDSSMLLTSSTNICIWCAEQLDKITVFSDSTFSGKINSLATVGSFFLCASLTSITGWDILTFKQSFVFSVKCEELKIDRHSKLFLAQIHIESIERVLNKEKRSAGMVMICDYNRISPDHLTVMEPSSELIMLPTSSKIDKRNVPNTIIATADSRILEREAPLVRVKGIMSSVHNHMDSLQNDKAEIVLNSTLLIRGSSSCFTHIASFQLPRISLMCGAFIDGLVKS